MCVRLSIYLEHVTELSWGLRSVVNMYELFKLILSTAFKWCMVFIAAAYLMNFLLLRSLVYHNRICLSIYLSACL